MQVARKRLDDYIPPDYSSTVKVLSRPEQHLASALKCLDGLFLTQDAKQQCVQWLTEMRTKQTKWFLAEPPERLARTAAMRFRN